MSSRGDGSLSVLRYAASLWCFAKRWKRSCFCTWSRSSSPANERNRPLPDTDIRSDCDTLPCARWCLKIQTGAPEFIMGTCSMNNDGPEHRLGHRERRVLIQTSNPLLSAPDFFPLIDQKQQERQSIAQWTPFIHQLSIIKKRTNNVAIIIIIIEIKTMGIHVVLLVSKTPRNLKSMASLFTKLTKCWISCHKKLPSSSIFVFWSLSYHRYLLGNSQLLAVVMLTWPVRMKQ